MTTWSSKPLIALSIIGLLSACDTADTGKGLAQRKDAAAPLTQALMMRGKITLVPPSGYCIDAKSLSQSFALMARCDTLGAATGGRGQPTGVLTVSFARSTKNATLPTAQEIATAAGLGVPENTREGEASVVFKTTGHAPASDLSPKHWRSISEIGEYTMSAALFGQKDQRAVSPEGASILEDMIKRTTDKTNAN
jgi:hypothetical protein